MVRITQNILSNRSLLFLQTNIERISRIQEQLSTGLRINRPADDPVDFPVSLSLRTTIYQDRRFQRNTTSARTNLELTETTLNGLTDVLQTVRQLAVEGATDIDSSARISIANEVAELYAQALDLANANYNGQYILGGSETKKQAFIATDGTVLYQGDDFERKVTIGKSQTIATNLTGLDTFLHTPNQITASIRIEDTSAPLAEQLRIANANYPNLPPLPDQPADASVDGSPNPTNSPTSSPNNLAEFTIYGETIRVDLSVDSLEDVRDRINANIDDVTASINSENQLVITSQRADALELSDGSRDTGFPPDTPYGANLLGALGMHRQVVSQRSLTTGYPATNPLSDPTADPAPERGAVRLEDDSFLFAVTNTGPEYEPATPFSDNLALTNIDQDGNEVILENGSPEFLTDLEAIRITIDDEVIDIDLRGLTQGNDFNGAGGSADDIPGSSLGDLLNLINNHPQLQGRASVYVNAEGTGLEVSAVDSTDVFKVEDVRKLFGRDITTRVTIDETTGEQSVSRYGDLELSTKLEDLPGALTDSAEGSLGIRNETSTSLNQGLIVIQNDGRSKTVDLREADTIGEVLNAINDADIGVLAEINETKTGINIISTTGTNDALSIMDMSDGTTAKDLGLIQPPSLKRIQSDPVITEGAAVSDLAAIDDGEFTIEIRDGSGLTMENYTIEVNADDSIEDLVKRIDEADGEAGPGGGLFSAQIIDGRLEIFSHYDGHTILIDSANDTTGADSATRFTEQIGIAGYTYTTEAEAETLSPYTSNQNTASILGWREEGTVDEVEEKNIFLTIKNLENALRNDDTEAIQDSLEALDYDLDIILNSRTQLGARMNRLDMVEYRLEDSEDLLRQQLSTVEDADLAELVTDLSTAENAFNAALQASALIVQQSLMDFLS